MKICWARSRYFTTCIFVLIMISTSANAGSFRNFILDEGLSASSRLSVQIPVNSQSATCMQCHDGSKAKSIGIKHADTVMTFTSHGSSNHPVGMLYDIYARKSPASYVALTKLNSRIKLENGQVTCVSCHETKQSFLHKLDIVSLKESDGTINTCSSTKELTTGPGQTRLCMSCHAM